MFFSNFLLFSIFIENTNIHNSFFLNKQSNFGSPILISNDIKAHKIGIVDFRYILKKSNAMKVLGNKFLIFEKKINQKIKQKQNYLKNIEAKLLKSKDNLSEDEYLKKMNLFKKEVFKFQKKYKNERILLNASFQKIQKKIKNLLAKTIKDISIEKNINVVLLKENVFLLNDLNIDFTNEALELFNKKTKSIKITITMSN